MINLDNLLEFIASDISIKKIIYIGVGSAQYSVRIMNNQKIIEIEQDQQYPYHIRNIQQKYPDYKTFLILIDKHLEEPCFTVVDKFSIDDNNKLSPEWGKNPFYENVYETHNTTLIEIREFVKYQEDDNPDSINIYNLLESLNELAMCFNWFVSFMDFTGRYITGLVSSFDRQLNYHMNHIIYGCPSRTELGCYVNLVEISDEFIMSYGEDGYIQCFNPYAYSNEELGVLFNEYKTDTSKMREFNMIRTQMMLLITIFKSKILSIYRRFLSKISNGAIGDVCDVKIDEVEYLIQVYGLIDIINVFKENPSNMVLQLESILDNEFFRLLDIFQIIDERRNEIYGRYIIYKSNPDIYKMYSDICNLVNSFI